MGQVVNVKMLEGFDPHVRLFELDRSLSGMGLKSYREPQDADGPTSDDRLARDLLDIPGVDTVFVNGNMVSVGREANAEWDRLIPGVVKKMRNLFVNYDIHQV